MNAPNVLATAFDAKTIEDFAKKLPEERNIGIVVKPPSPPPPPPAVATGFESVDALFLPVKPKLAGLIIGGQKTLELRKRAPTWQTPMPVLIYAMYPYSAVIGTVEWFGADHKQRVDEFTQQDLEDACMSRPELLAYYGTSTTAHCLRLRNAKFLCPVPLSVLRSRFGIESPLQWRYVSAEIFNKIQEYRP